MEAPQRREESLSLVRLSLDPDPDLLVDDDDDDAFIRLLLEPIIATTKLCFLFLEIMEMIPQK